MINKFQFNLKPLSLNPLINGSENKEENVNENSEIKLPKQNATKQLTFNDIYSGRNAVAALNISNLIVEKYKDPDSSLETLKKEAQECKEELLELSNQIGCLTVPNPPLLSDYNKSDGTGIDEESYQKAYEQYQRNYEDYMTQLESLNEKIIKLTDRLRKLNEQINEIELKNRQKQLKEEIETLKQSPNANQEVIEALEKELEQITLNSALDSNALYGRLEKLYIELNSLNVPIPPHTSDFITADGEADEKAYKEAFDKYNQDFNEYRKRKSEIIVQIAILENEAREINNKSANAAMNNLEKNINSVKTIQALLDGLKNTPENQAKIEELKTILEKLAENIDSQIDINSQMDSLAKEIIDIEVPVPPAVSDYTKIEYSYILGPNKFTFSEKDIIENADGTCVIKLSDGNLVECSIEKDENGMITELFIKDPKTGEDIRVQLQTTVKTDDKAYEKAYEEYKENCKLYDIKMQALNADIEALQKELEKLQKQCEDWVTKAVFRNSLMLQFNNKSFELDTLCMQVPKFIY